MNKHSNFLTFDVWTQIYFNFKNSFNLFDCIRK